jgi:phospholipase C
LPYAVQAKCDAGHYYPAVNVGPSWTPQGTPSGAGSVPPVTMTSIGDLLSAKNILEALSRQL